MHNVLPGRVVKVTYVDRQAANYDDSITTLRVGEHYRHGPIIERISIARNGEEEGRFPLMIVVETVDSQIVMPYPEIIEFEVVQ